jgi:hypothetical protein
MITTKVKVGGKDVMDIVLDGEIDEILYQSRWYHGCRRDGRKISNG